MMNDRLTAMESRSPRLSISQRILFFVGVVLLFPLLVACAERAPTPQIDRVSSATHPSTISPRVEPKFEPSTIAARRSSQRSQTREDVSPRMRRSHEPPNREALVEGNVGDLNVLGEPELPTVDKTARSSHRASEVTQLRTTTEVVSTPEAAPAHPEAGRELQDFAAPPQGQPLTETAAPLPSPSPTATPIAEVDKNLQLKRIPITGKVDIDFHSRLVALRGGDETSDAAKDTYQVALNFSKAINIAGDISRVPRTFSLLGRESRPLTYDFNLLFQPSNTKWVGSFGIASDGTYRFGEGLRLVGTRGGAFGGRIRGRAEEKQGSVKSLLREYSRIFRGKRFTVQARKVDPIQIETLKLPQGPNDFPACTVSGSFDFDYETGNWFASPLRFRYQSSDSVRTDTVTGSIKWIEDPSRKTNGKGQYEFNLRFNEDASKGVGGESDFFENKTEESEEAFFAVDDTVPGIFGTISYKDTFEGAEDSVVQSAVTYDIYGRGLSEEQLMNFLKLWLLITGPANDE